VTRCPEFGGLSFAASCNIQAVKASAAGYLGKYMSKGPGVLSAILADDPGLAEFLPKTWWFCSDRLRTYIRKSSAYGTERANQIMHWVRTDSPLILGSHLVEIPMADGSKIPVAVVGRLSEGGRLRVGVAHQVNLRLAGAVR